MGQPDERAATPEEIRTGVLLEWWWRTRRAGHAVPSRKDVELIATTGQLWPPGIDVAAAEPWRDAIDFLLTQVKFGMRDPVSRLPKRGPVAPPWRTWRA